MPRTKLVSRNSFNKRKAQFCATQLMAAAQNPPPQIVNKTFVIEE